MSRGSNMNCRFCCNAGSRPFRNSSNSTAGINAGNLSGGGLGGVVGLEGGEEDLAIGSVGKVFIMINCVVSNEVMTIVARVA